MDEPCYLRALSGSQRHDGECSVRSEELLYVSRGRIWVSGSVNNCVNSRDFVRQRVDFLFEGDGEMLCINTISGHRQSGCWDDPDRPSSMLECLDDRGTNEAGSPQNRSRLRFGCGHLLTHDLSTS